MTNPIRIIAYTENGMWVGQCLEHDIGAQGATEEEMLERLDAVLHAELEYTTKTHGEAFANIEPAPQFFFDRWSKCVWTTYYPSEQYKALQARYDKLEAAAREACEQLKSLAYASHKATGRPLSKRPRTKMLQRPEKVRDNLLAVRKVLRYALLPKENEDE
jgi:hypothetical protein